MSIQSALTAVTDSDLDDFVFFYVLMKSAVDGSASFDLENVRLEVSPLQRRLQNALARLERAGKVRIAVRDQPQGLSLSDGS